MRFLEFTFPILASSVTAREELPGFWSRRDEPEKNHDATASARVGSRPVMLIEAPSNLGLKPPAPGREPGVRRLPEALTAAGLRDRLRVRRSGRVEAPPYSDAIDPATGVRNAPAIADYSIALADAVGTAIDRGGFPLVLGGDCSIILGNLLALRRRGRYGLAFVDGHADLCTPENSPSHAAAGMDLALATGVGPERLTNLEGLRPLVRERDVALFGVRESEPTPNAAAVFTPAILRALGIRETVSRESERLRSHGARRFWIHVDADVLDRQIMPAVDTPEPDGLTLEELTSLLAELLGTGLAAGMNVGIYDPDLDPDGRYARALVDVLAGAFERAVGDAASEE